jgi:hypothetical protein
MVVCVRCYDENAEFICGEYVSCVVDHLIARGIDPDFDEMGLLFWPSTNDPQRAF